MSQPATDKATSIASAPAASLTRRRLHKRAPMIWLPPISTRERCLPHSTAAVVRYRCKTCSGGTPSSTGTSRWGRSDAPTRSGLPYRRANAATLRGLIGAMKSSLKAALSAGSAAVLLAVRTSPSACSHTNLGQCFQDRGGEVSAATKGNTTTPTLITSSGVMRNASG
jgi:hypothetical protein